MEDPRKHEQKNGRTMPVAINIGAGAGIGGVVLFGGSLVTAALVAFNRSRRQSSSEIINKSRSPSLETQTVDAPNQLESLSLNLQKSSNDEEMSLKEIQINVKDLNLDEKHNSVIDVAEHENKTICVDSVSEEQVVMAADIESGPPSSDDDSGSDIMERDDDGEEQKNSILKVNENDEHVKTKSLDSYEAVTSTEETPEAAQDHVLLKDDKLPIEDDKIPIEDDKMPIEDNPPLQFPEKEEIQSETKVCDDDDDDDDDDDQRTIKKDNPPTQLMNKEEHKDAEENITEEELIKEDGIQSIEEDDNSKKDGRSKTEISSDVEDSSTEEQTQDPKISDQKNQEHMEENQTSVPKTNQLKKQGSVTRKLKNTWRKIRQL